MIEIERIERVDLALTTGLNALFDAGMTWDEGNGRAFLANPDALLLVARWDGVVCGFLTAYRLPRFDGMGAEVNLYEIATDEAYQRRGVGRALVDAVRRWAVEVGAANVWVLTEVDNEAAQALYTATGGERDEPACTMYTYPIASGFGPALPDRAGGEEAR